MMWAIFLLVLNVFFCSLNIYFENYYMLPVSTVGIFFSIVLVWLSSLERN